jgi:hypothetical protein
VKGSFPSSQLGCYIFAGGGYCGLRPDGSGRIPPEADCARLVNQSGGATRFVLVLNAAARRLGFGSAELDSPSSEAHRLDMSLLELKQEVSRLNKRERRELQAYLIRLRHNTPEWKKATAKRIKAMQAGRRVTAEDLEARIGRG